MSLLSWTILCILLYFAADIIPIGDAIVNKVIKVLCVIGLAVLFFISVRS